MGLIRITNTSFGHCVSYTEVIGNKCHFVTFASFYPYVQSGMT